MIADALRLEIEAHAQRGRMGNPLFVHAAAGTMTPAAVGRYLVALHYMVERTPPNIARARDRARAAGLEALADYYAKKFLEEDGHQLWSAADLEVFRETFGIPIEPTPVPAIVELADYLRELIDREPVLYVPYLLFVEYITVLTGGELVRLLVERCGVPAEALTCASNHVELDQEHTDEGLDVIDALVDDPRMLEPLRRVLRKSMDLFDRASEQMVGSAAEIERVAS